MIFSRRHNFLFIKNQKVGGTAVEMALAPLCGPEDIVTPITAVDEYQRVAHGGACRNFSNDPDLERAYLDALARNGGRGGRPKQIDAKAIFYNHMTVAELRDRMGGELDDVVSFAIERHPYEKALSVAAMAVNWEAYVSDGAGLGGDLETLRDTFDNLVQRPTINKIVNYPRYHEQGRLRVDRVLDHADLAAQLGKLASELGLELPAELPRAKVSRRDRSRPAGEVLRPDQKARIYDLCAPEFELMGYEA